MSLAHWDQDDPWEMKGDHVFLPGEERRGTVSPVVSPVPSPFPSVPVHALPDSSIPCWWDGRDTQREGRMFVFTLASCPVCVSESIIPGGNLRLVEGLLSNTYVLYNSVVERIDYTGRGGAPVVIHTEEGSSYQGMCAVHRQLAPSDSIN